MPEGQPFIQVAFRALLRLPQRDAQRLMMRVAEGRPERDCAALYGVTPEAFRVALYRSARLWARAVEDPSGPPLLPPDAGFEPEAQEAEAARRLASALDADALPEEPVASLVWRAMREGAALKQAALDHQRAFEASPAARREDLLRKAAFVLLLLVAAWLYFFRRG